MFAALRLPAMVAITGLGLLLGTALPERARAAEVTVFAAASLTNALQEIERLYEQQSGDQITISFAGSSALARQIEAGAPADIFISASPDWMDELQAKDLIEAASRVDLLRNTLVLVAHGSDAAPVEIGPDLDLAGLLSGGKLAMAFVDAVPAGIYGKAALQSLGLWEGVENDVAQADNVRTALSLVAAGEAPYGIVYATDAVAEDDVSVIGTFPQDSHPPIVYPAAELTERTNDAAKAFMAFLEGPEAKAAFERQGFTTLL